MKVLKIMIVMLLLIISVGGVCAADDISDEIMSNDCQDTLEIEQNDIYKTGESSFSSLADEIENASTVLDLSQNYIFNNATDYELNEGIVINKSDFTINGNDYTIDGNNLARIFNIIGGNNITISNLNFVNGKCKSGGAIYTVSPITFINVTFAENSAIMAGAVSSTQKAVFNNVTFINNTATRGGAIYSEEGYLELINCQFNNNTATWGGSIYCKNETRISNSAFRNSKSSYGAAIYAGNMFTVKNSTFENLYANETAGAIGIKGFDYVEIDGCTFINTGSRKNGGAVFIDIGPRETGTSSITNSKFISSSGDYGGALVQLGGKIFIGGCEFTNNSAIYDGGAIYLSYLSAVINNTLVNENKLSYENLSCGGGLYCDVFNITIENSNFTDNAIQGIYAYDSELNMKNIIFSNNGEAIHGIFLIYNLKNITLGNDTLFLNDTNYDTDFYEIAKNLVLINNTINVATLPSRYDSREWGWVSTVKDQGDMGSCWTFGTCGALESALLKATGIEYDFSENNMQNSMLQYSKYGIKGEEEGGAREQGLEYVLSWFGVMPSEFDTYDQLGKLSPLITSNDKIHIFDAGFADPRKNATDNDMLKKLILLCGSVTTGYYHNDSCLNEKTFAYYQNTKNRTNHAISLVGWDDNYPASNFLETPPGNGAFILKNSWGSSFGEDGYMYISYYDTSLLNTSFAIGFIIENTENYTTNYQTDLGGHLEHIKGNGSIISYMNTYKTDNIGLISAIGSYFDVNENYTFEIYVNGELKHNQSGIAPFTGYHTIKLTTEIPITTGDIFKALMKKESVYLLTDSRQIYRENITFIDFGDGWKDLSLENKTISLKVYAKDLDIYTQDLVKIYKNDSKFEANIGVANETVTFEINGRNYTRISDEDGTASIAINLGPGNYTIKTTFNGTTVENTITVLSTLIADNLVKYYRNASQFYIDLIDGEGNPVSGVNITMNINGVFYNRATNENGTARLNINLPPGEYILTAVDPLTGLQMSYNITVLPTLYASDLEMSYKDGSTFNATVLDGQGNPLKDATVKFNINGIFYNRKTNSDEIAMLNITLMSGKYIITSEYDGLKVSNTIIIKD